MSTRTAYRDGQFCWAELATTDTTKAKTFYESMFDWKFEDMPMSDDMVYTMVKYKDKYVCAMFNMDDKMKAQHIPPNWGQYISTTHLEDTAGKVENFGGKVITKPFDVFTAGRMAICQDSEGATFYLWQPKEHFGAQIVNETNCWGWSELTSWDIEKAKAFYSGVFGWQFEDDAGNNQYLVIKNGPEMNGGILNAKAAGLDSHIPATWSAYFTVDNIQTTVNTIKNKGGQIVMPPMEAKGVGTFSVVKDPQGAYFQVIQLNEPPKD